MEWRGERCGDFLACNSAAFLFISRSSSEVLGLSEDTEDDSDWMSGRNGGGKNKSVNVTFPSLV